MGIRFSKKRREKSREKRTEEFSFYVLQTASMKINEVLDHDIKVLWLCLIPSVQNVLEE